MILKNFIVFEGLDGAGTTTQAGLLHKKCADRGIPSFLTMEPTEHLSGQTIRRILRKECGALAQTMAYLFAADRNEHVYSVGGIRENAQKGALVISDRYLFSSLAYQSVECGWDFVKNLNERFPLPEILVFLDISPQTGENRLRNREKREIYEYTDFQAKAAAGYKRVLKDFAASGMKILNLDGTQTPETLHEKIWDFIQNR
jgi:dTMP kinase